VQDDGAKRTDGLASAEAVTGDLEKACSIVAVGDNEVSCGDCRDDVSGAMREEACVNGTFFLSYPSCSPHALGSASGHATATYETILHGPISPALYTRKRQETRKRRDSSHRS
jgi:hypothetical protein